MAVYRSQTTYFGAKYRRIKSRRVRIKGLVASEHSILTAVWHMLATDEVYRDPGPGLLRQTPTGPQAIEGWAMFKKSSQPGSSPSWMSYIRDFGRWIRSHRTPEAYVLAESWC